MLIVFFIYFSLLPEKLNGLSESNTITDPKMVWKVYWISNPISLNPKTRTAPPNAINPRNTPSARIIIPIDSGRLLAPLIFCINFDREFILLFD